MAILPGIKRREFLTITGRTASGILLGSFLIPDAEASEYLDLKELPLAPEELRRSQNYQDPNKTGNKLLDINGHEREYVDKKFRLCEFAKTAGKTQRYIRLDPRIVDVAQTIRDEVKAPVIITSGYRSWKRTCEIYADDIKEGAGRIKAGI